MSNVPVLAVDFTAPMPYGSTVTSTVYVFLEDGFITPTGTETFQVYSGTIKFDIEVTTAQA